MEATPRKSQREAVERALARAARGAADCDIWHTPFYRIPDTWAGKLVVTFYDLSHFLFPEFFTSRKARLFAARQRQSAERADLILSISKTTAADLTRLLGIEPEKIRVVPLAIEPNFVDGGRDLAAPLEPYILTVGRRPGIKNVTTLLEAYARWPRNAEVGLVLAGPTATPSEIRQLDRLGVLRRATFLGHVDDRQLSSLYRHALAFVYPSLYEGFGIPLLEAMACSCPIVASSIPSSHEIAGTVPYYFQPRDVDSLLAALDQVVAAGTDAARRQQARTTAGAFDWNSTTSLTVESYKELL